MDLNRIRGRGEKDLVHHLNELIGILYEYIFSNGSVWCVTSTGCRLTGSALGKKEKRAESVGQEAAEEFIRNWKSQSCVDE